MISNQLPNLFDLFEQLPDTRLRSEYNMAEICGGALVMSMLKCGSRNNYNNVKRSSIFCQNFETAFDIFLPHADSFDDVFRKLPPKHLENVRTQLVKHLLENKSLRSERLFTGQYLIAVDATGMSSFTERHCPYCLTKTSKNGVTSYFHYVLEAKLITPSGLAISLASEFVENQAERNFNKQDCEQKAFKRIAEKIKKTFPRLPICLLADGLYPNKKVFDLCEKFNWSFIITLKDKTLKSFQEEVNLLKCKVKGRKEVKEDKHNIISRKYQYLNDIEYKNNKYTWASCIETVTNKKTQKLTEKQFVYITNIEQSLENIVETISSGRLRWIIENQGFNTQKNAGYELEHKFSRVNYNAMQNYYLILQIAHLINQLIEKSNTIILLLKVDSKMTIKNLWSLLLAYLRFFVHNSTEIYKE